MSTSVLRRYTPPTCTLEIAATGSALSRWTDRTVMKHLKFNLSFDDPKLASDRQVKVTGDRIQLDALCDAVVTYVQQFLDSDTTGSPELLRLAPDYPPLVASGNLPHESEQNGHPGKHGLTALPGGMQTAPANRFSSPAGVPEGIYLHPRGLLAHELHLGTLATEESGQVIRLSATQLFDLANALDEYTAEAIALPALGRAKWSSAGWARIAAVMLLALGATGGIAKFVMDVTAPAPTSVATTQTAETSQPESLGQSTPLPSPSPLPTPTPVPIPTVGGIPLPPPGVAKQPSTQMPTVGVPQQLPPGAYSRQPATRVPAPAPVPAPVQGGGAPTRVPVSPILPNEVAIAPNPSIANSAQSESLPSGQPDAALAPNAPSIASTEVAPQPQMDSAGAAATTMRSAAPRRSNSSIPQVAEAQAYFASRWQPPENLRETLEYRILVGADGTVQRVVPLGTVAGNYLDRTGMPLAGEPLVSPLSDNAQSALIRLVIAPDGQIQTFLEEEN